MFHLVARGADWRLLFRTWPEGLALWSRVTRGVAGIVALTVMPDHLHLIHPLDVRVELSQVLAGFARWRNRQRGERGRVFEPLPKAEPLPTHERRRRTVRYVHLNPCRAGIVADPLLWPLSTHRDMCGLALPPVVKVHVDPPDFHRRVSGDPTVAIAGTRLPEPTVVTDDLLAVRDAVSAVTRTPLPSLARRGHARALFLHAADELCPSAGRIEAARLVDAGRVTAWRARRPAADLAVVSRALHDPRFPALDDSDLRERPGWERYRRS